MYNDTLTSPNNDVHYTEVPLYYYKLSINYMMYMCMLNTCIVGTCAHMLFHNTFHSHVVLT